MYKVSPPTLVSLTLTTCTHTHTHTHTSWGKQFSNWDDHVWPDLYTTGLSWFGLTYVVSNWVNLVKSRLSWFRNGLTGLKLDQLVLNNRARNDLLTTVSWSHGLHGVDYFRTILYTCYACDQ